MSHKLIIVLVGFFLFFSPNNVFAHPFIPPQDLLQQFLNANPDAAKEDIQKWAEEQNIQFHASNSGQIEELQKKAKEKSFLERLISNAIEFIKLGIEHIFTGFDHILFIVAMMLTFISFKDIFRLTGTFTLAHSITLILAGTFFLSISSKIVEPIIAFSIAYMAIATSRKTKIPTVFLFGLVHGLGFAGVLKEIKIPSDFFLPSLLFFNVGIEIGQLILISVFIIPVLFLIRKTPWKNQITKTIAIVISIIGIFWGIERLLS